MLHKLKTNYKDIAKYLPCLDTTISTCAYKKQQLLNMAKNGEPRPSHDKTKLGAALCSYTLKRSKCFDEKFYENIKSIRPDWFVSQTDIANQKKNELIKMAKNGESRPKHKTKLGQALCCYTGKSSDSFDKEFYEKIKSIRPDWFLSRTEIANQKKEELIRMAKNGEDKPNHKTKLGRSLNNYTVKSSNSFDKKFYENIKSIRPDWFVSPTEIANQNKEKLIRMAKNGESRPKRKTKIGRALSEYTKKSSSSFDKEFYEKIKSIRPDWFVSPTEIANQNKEKLIRMAKNGEDRPSQKIKLGSALCSYTAKSSNCFDKKFYENIKSIRPDWFKHHYKYYNKK